MTALWTMPRHRAFLSMVIAAALIAPPSMAQQPSVQRQQELVRLVRQDCGACHGLRLTGGLGPALTPAALASRSVPALAATIIHGRRGTPMPGWQSMLREGEADWIAAWLKEGFPEQ
ncbi:MAG: cytochrome c [Burkholderiales bacterium]